MKPATNWPAQKLRSFWPNSSLHRRWCNAVHRALERAGYDFREEEI
jgi:hypothetical protein